jgi:hypothetical protein
MVQVKGLGSLVSKCYSSWSRRGLSPAIPTNCLQFYCVSSQYSSLPAAAWPCCSGQFLQGHSALQSYCYPTVRAISSLQLLLFVLPAQQRWERLPKSLLGPDVITSLGKQRGCFPDAHKVSWAACLYSQKGDRTRLSAPITAVPSCFHQS